MRHFGIKTHLSSKLSAIVILSALVSNDLKKQRILAYVEPQQNSIGIFIIIIFWQEEMTSEIQTPSC